MKLIKSVIVLFLLFISINPVRGQVLKGEVSHVPDAFFGSWRVVSERIETDSPVSFKEKGVDLWNLFLDNDVIKLCNPFSGATAEIQIKKSGLNHVVFSKQGKYNNKLLTDTVSINIKGDTFTGENTLKLETLSEVDGTVLKTESAKYSLSGERISGQSVEDN